MSTIAELRVPASDTAMPTTFEHAPEAMFELESSVSKALPPLWVSGVDAETIEKAFDADPTVENVERLTEDDDRLLYDLECEPAHQLYDELLTEGGSLLELCGKDGWWTIRMRFQDRDALSRTHTHLQDHGISVDLQRVTDVSSHSTAETRLTPQQHEALTAALEYGYFEIPRQISMEELATKLDISHQALSERLRRAYETLVDAELQPVTKQ